MKKQLLAVAVSSVLFSTVLSAAQGPIPKQLAGPAEDIASMRAPDPASAAIHSKSALIAVDMLNDKAGNATWQMNLPIESDALRFLVFSGATDRWDVQIGNPDGSSNPAKTLAREVRETAFGMQGESFPAQQFDLLGLSGERTLKLSAQAGQERGGFVLIEGDAATELASYPAQRNQKVGERITLVAMLTDGSDAAMSGEAKLGNAAGRIQQASLRVTSPNGDVQTLPMFDDGLHADSEANDGIYGGDFSAANEGTWLAQVVVRGTNAAGRSLIRTAEHVIPVVTPSIELATEKASIGVRTTENSRWMLDIPVVAKAKGQHYRAYAEVWGQDAQGEMKAVAWIGGMTEAQDGKLSLALDSRWVARSKAQGRFELRNLRIEDPDHFVSLAEADALPLSLPTLDAKAYAPDIQIDDSMRMGNRPAQAAVSKGTGSRLLLVHGYCSSDVWPASHFTNTSKFLDLNANRSHDDFARRIQTFGNTWASYGIVAHSQGGAAALHLYNYYWSGLDYATGSRLIQSVGTPYQGTNLAGILASLGSWFGVGCGTNSNLTYSGASSWLAGIPTSSRAKVNYYTTSFTDRSWVYDYCHLGTDLVLSDPEDGTTEKAYGQLSGAVNRGHATGQCHTTGMRDPAQYQNSSRNATMNSNAAR
ncbi:MAG TPA: conditioned medium factor [Aquimonas sp.]|nr:conditioned medium factor [Xanthomonadales bacterium]HRD72220.1 conditioned medium factor [Aquimonas sp.]HRF54973.1 conditioned medium factor [Aquimonas sp.]